MQFMDDTYAITAQFGSPAEAEAAGAAIRDWLAAQSISTESVHTADKLVFVAGREAGGDTIRKIRDQLQEQGCKTLFEQNTGEKAIMLFMTCLAPDDSTAQRIDAEMNDYFQAAFYLGPKAPWESVEESAQDLTEDEARARTTLQLVHESWESAAISERIQEIHRRAFSNPLKGLLTIFSKKRHDRLYEEMRQAMFETVEEQITQRAEESGLEIDMSQVLNPLKQRDPMSRFIGYYLYQPRPKQAITGFGGFEREGRLLIFDFVMFHRFAYGFPAMLGYLRDQGCTAFDYRLEDFNDVRED